MQQACHCAINAVNCVKLRGKINKIKWMLFARQYARAAKPIFFHAVVDLRYFRITPWVIYLASKTTAIYIAFVVKPKFITDNLRMLLQRHDIVAMRRCFCVGTTIWFYAIDYCIGRKVRPRQSTWRGIQWFYHDLFSIHISWSRWGQTWWRRQQQNTADK